MDLCRHESHLSPERRVQRARQSAPRHLLQSHALWSVPLPSMAPDQIRLLQDLEALAALHNNSCPQSCTFPITDATAPVVVQPPVITTLVCEQRVATPELVQVTRVDTSQFLQESRVVLPTLAIANLIVTTPSAPLPIVALTSPQYPPPPGLPLLHNTDQPNHLLGKPLSKPTIPVVAVPTRQSPRPQRKRTSDIYAYSAVSAPAPAIPAPYIAIVHGDIDRITAPPLTPSEVANLLSAADNAWLRNTDHLARANAASIIERFECTDLFDDVSDVDSDPVNAYATTPLNVNPDGSPLTYRTATHGPESAD
jgi:hypothetical protein